MGDLIDSDATGHDPPERTSILCRINLRVRMKRADIATIHGNICEIEGLSRSGFVVEKLSIAGATLPGNLTLFHNQFASNKFGPDSHRKGNS
jgi:hypothetical protein